jgi:uncharacterized protein (TIGR03435 family)
LKFEVASIRPGEAGASPGGTFLAPGGERYVGSNVCVKFLVMDAYRVNRDQISGGPVWFGSDLYNLNAKAERPATLDEMRTMLQNLTTDRLKLQVTRETRDGNFYALVVDKGGAKLELHETSSASEPFADTKEPRPGQEFKIAWHATSAPMDYLAWRLSQIVNLPVMDRTGLKGAYDFDLAFTRQLPPGIPEGALINGVAIDTSGLTVFEALARLGLRLERQKGPVDFLRIDRVERPTEN